MVKIKESELFDYLWTDCDPLEKKSVFKEISYEEYLKELEKQAQEELKNEIEIVEG